MRINRLLVGILACIPAALACAEQHTSGTPQLSSLPGAAYTIYLDVAGFTYNGTWGGGTPGTTPAYADVASSGTFNATQQGDIKNIWSRVAQSYGVFNVNVTTVDPDTTAGHTDAQRQTFYDNTPKLMHTIIGSQVRSGVKWYSNFADGVSQLSVVAPVAPNAGDHTNWMFTEAAVGDGDYIGRVAAHEDGHAFGLNHQSDYKTGAVLWNEYSQGDVLAGHTGNGSYNPIMGNAFGTQRTNWRSGTAHTGLAGHSQNDVQQMLTTDTGLSYVNDGISHTMSLASTPLPLTGNAVNPSLAKGIITPTSTASANPTGAANYTKDYFSFFSDGLTPLTLTCTDGSSYLTPGVADGIGTLRSTLTIFNLLGVPVGTGTEAASTLQETFTGTLAAGTYYAEIASFGGHLQDAVTGYESGGTYYDMGAYFLTGSGFAALPEPSVFGLLCVGVILLTRHRFVVTLKSNYV